MIDSQYNKRCTFCGSLLSVCLKTGALIEISPNKYTCDAFVCNDCGAISYFGIPTNPEDRNNPIAEEHYLLLPADFYIGQEDVEFVPYPGEPSRYFYLLGAITLQVQPKMVDYFKKWYPEWYTKVGHEIPVRE